MTQQFSAPVAAYGDVVHDGIFLWTDNRNKCRCVARRGDDSSICAKWFQARAIVQIDIRIDRLKFCTAEKSAHDPAAKADALQLAMV